MFRSIRRHPQLVVAGFTAATAIASIIEGAPLIVVAFFGLVTLMVCLTLQILVQSAHLLECPGAARDPKPASSRRGTLALDAVKKALKTYDVHSHEWKWWSVRALPGTAVVHNVDCDYDEWVQTDLHVLEGPLKGTWKRNFSGIRKSIWSRMDGGIVTPEADEEVEMLMKAMWNQTLGEAQEARDMQASMWGFDKSVKVVDGEAFSFRRRVLRIAAG
jgi:hypothetical protein